ncbi:MAG: rhodanese-like domain-containing protein, partial [Bacteroidia bacterium]|nr:rhodanese-like domain-containing protein [Bacteroidia bacterium]
FSVEHQSQYTPRDAYQRCLAGSVILDVRPEILWCYKGFNVPEVLYCPWRDIEKYIDRLPAEKEIIVADSSGNHSRAAIKILIDAGFSKVAGLAGGMVEWERDGLPLQLDNQARLSGSCMCQLKFRELKKP